jgi:predicted transcriptional regulator
MANTAYSFDLLIIGKLNKLGLYCKSEENGKKLFRITMKQT